MNKICTKCGEEKRLSDFYPHKRDKIMSMCKKCSNAEAKNWYESIGDKKSYKKNINLKHRHGITLDDFNEMMQKQNGKCAICGRGPGFYGFHVDHSHKSGKVRQLLCAKCNTVLGQAQYVTV